MYQHGDSFSRRDFLKASGAGLLGLFLAELHLDRTFAAEIPKQGRMTISGIELFSEPSFNTKKLHTFGRDEIVEIKGAFEGDNGYGNPFNSTWYQIDEGYAYSGWIQPVQTVHQKAVYDISEGGVLGEIIVPVCDTRLDMSVLAKHGYRLYYSSTHWITDVTINRNEKSSWYKIFDREIQKSFYVASHEMRVIPATELSLLSPEVPEEEKRIYIDLSTQIVTAFEGEKPVLITRCASGAKGTETPTGEFRTFHKGPSIHMTNQGDGSEYAYHLPGVPWVSFFTGTGVALHGTYWHNNYGRPSSHGCVNLTPQDAKFIYRWSRPEVPPETQYLYRPGEGTRVQVVPAS